MRLAAILDDPDAARMRLFTMLSIRPRGPSECTIMTARVFGVIACDELLGPML